MSLRETSEVKTVLIIYLISFLLSLKIREVEEPNKKKEKQLKKYEKKILDRLKTARKEEGRWSRG